MVRTLTKVQIMAMQEGRKRKAAENAAQPRPASDPKLGDAYVNAEAARRLAATGVALGDTIEIVRGKHKGERYVVEVVKATEAEVFAGYRWWTAYIQPPQFKVVR